MRTASGVLGIIGGVFGFLAAIFTIFMGGVGAALEAEGASTVLGLGWGGVAFSFLCIVFGALSFSGGKVISVLLLLSAIAGIILGGTFVAVCMVLSAIGGLLGLFSSKKQKTDLGTEVESAKQKVNTKYVLYTTAATALILISFGLFSSSDNADKETPKVAKLASLELFKQVEIHNDIKPYGELAEIFSYSGNATDLQRENALAFIKGKAIAWSLPVKDIKKEKDYFSVETSGAADELFGQSDNVPVSTLIRIYADNENTVRYLSGLKSGDFIEFKGVLTGKTSMRKLLIDPATVEYSENIHPPKENEVFPREEEVLMDALSERDGRIFINELSYTESNIQLCQRIQNDLGYRILDPLDYEGIFKKSRHLSVKAMVCGGVPLETAQSISQMKHKKSAEEAILDMPLDMMKQFDPTIVYKLQGLCPTLVKETLRLRDLNEKYSNANKCISANGAVETEKKKSEISTATKKSRKTDDEIERFYRDVLYPEMERAFENKFKHDLCLKYVRENASSKVDTEKLSYADKIFNKQYDDLLKRAECMGIYSDYVVDVKQDTEEELLSTDMGNIFETAFYAPYDAPENRKRIVEENCTKLAKSAYDSKSILENSASSKSCR